MAALAGPPYDVMAMHRSALVLIRATAGARRAVDNICAAIGTFARRLDLRTALPAGHLWSPEAASEAQKCDEQQEEDHDLDDHGALNPNCAQSA